MSLLDVFDLGKGFQKHFRIHSAHDQRLRDDVYRIRHAVYCVDLGFEPVRADGMERDSFDAHSLHCLLRTATPTPAPVGCVRLVMSEPGALLPFERTCEQAIDRRIVDPSRLDRSTIAEVSRLAVLSQFRRRKGEHAAPAGLPDEAPDQASSSGKLPSFPYIPVSLYMGSIALARANNVETIFMLTEPRLAAHFSRLGVRVRQIGSPIEHRGQRVPSMIDVEEVVRTMHRMMRPFWRVVSEQVLQEKITPAPCNDEIIKAA